MNRTNLPPDDAVNSAAKSPATPSELMREWRPELFSDTVRDREPTVPRAVMDHHLETLTNRKEEDEFEYFARLLCERQICPNLRPQTGPSGGGDSKVDSETYPVAAEIATQWYYSQPKAANERWAFAFSTKKKWRDKVTADVASVSSTGRPYTRIFFVTSQYAPDKARAAAEDKFSLEAGVPVTILDRSWILEKLYADDLLELAVRSLNMTGYSIGTATQAGPRDVERDIELKRLDDMVADPSRYAGVRFALAEDALQSALLARGLERPRSEIEGRFAVAARIADEVGHPGQRLRVAYHRAWTALWFFNDASALDEHYENVEAIALDSDDADHLERLVTLWQLLAPTVARGALTPDRARVATREASILTALDRVARVSERPNNALHARTFLQVMRLTHLLGEKRPDALNEVWDSLREILSQVDGLGDYPVEHVHELIARMGQYVPESEGYDRLFDVLVELLERRRSEVGGGLALLERGSQKLSKGLPYDAIRLLGRAEGKLAKAEYVDELVQTLVGIASAYRQVGLPWAARAKALLAIDKLLVDFRRNGRLDPRASVPARLLAWLELELGRVPQALAAIGLYRAIVTSTDQPPAIAEQVPEHLQTLEAVLGILLLKAKATDLNDLSRLPARLEREGLVLAKNALLWRLAGASAVREDGYAPDTQSDEDLSKFFAIWMAQPAAEELPEQPILCNGEVVELKTVVLGINLVVRSKTDRGSILLSEAILAAVESFLSTSLVHDLFPLRETFTLTVRPSDDAKPRLSYTADEHSGLIEIEHGPGDLAGAADQASLTDWLQEVMVHIVLSMVMAPDLQDWIENLATEEGAFNRALALCSVAVTTRNLFGDEPPILLADWIDADAEPVRIAPPADPETTSQTSPPPEAKAPKFGSGDPPPFPHPEKGLHSDRRILSAINSPLWDRAKWRATGFGWGGGPPFLAIAFEDYASGQAIFREWRERFGDDDANEELRIAIIRGIDRTEPLAYKVHISMNLKGSHVEGSTFYLTSRINRMTPGSDANLNRFLSAYAIDGRYLLAPMRFDAVGGQSTLDTSLCIAKSTIIVRDAWEVDEHDPDVVCIDPGEHPVIPDGVDNAPVLRALARRIGSRERGKRN